MLIFHAICSKYARNIHENLRKIHKTTLSSCCCVCSVHGRSTSTSILGGVFLFFYARISSNMVEKSKMMQYARNMLEKWCNMLDLCSGRFFHRNMLGEYAGMFHEGQLYGLQYGGVLVVLYIFFIITVFKKNMRYRTEHRYTVYGIRYTVYIRYIPCWYV